MRRSGRLADLVKGLTFSTGQSAGSAYICSAIPNFQRCILKHDTASHEAPLLPGTVLELLSPAATLATPGPQTIPTVFPSYSKAAAGKD
jgi:hypothetical protein